MKKITITLIICSTFFCMAHSQQKPQATINHIALYVVNLQTSEAFYKNIIGLDTIPEPFHDGKHCWLNIGNHAALHLIEGATAPKEYFKNNHICFSVNALESFIEKLKQKNFFWEDVKGTKNAITTRPDGVQQIWLQDPDGYWIEINNAKF